MIFILENFDAKYFKDINETVIQLYIILHESKICGTCVLAHTTPVKMTVALYENTIYCLSNNIEVDSFIFINIFVAMKKPTHFLVLNSISR